MNQFVILFAVAAFCFLSSSRASIEKREASWTWTDEWDIEWTNGCDWPVQDIGHTGADSSQCGQLCAYTPGCTHYTWSYAGCWLKDGEVDTAKAFAFPGAVCGYVKQKWHDNGNFEWANDCDWAPNEIDIVSVISSQCGPACANKPGCTHFTWVEMTGLCYLKKGAVTFYDAIAHTISPGHSMCGYMK